VTLPAATALISLSDLHLQDACALLSHGTEAALPPIEESPTLYLQSVIDGLCSLSLRDPLTGLANRRHFMAVLEREIAVVARSGESTLLLLLDIDFFKKINDTHGHPAGDKVLQTVAKCLTECVRPKDTVVRYGGEEFAVILPDCQVSYGHTVAERMRATIEALVITVAPGVAISATISIGGAYAPEWVRSTAAIWTERADTELYRAKTSGRNRVCLDVQQVMAVSAEEKNLLFGHLALGTPAWLENSAGDFSNGAAQDSSAGGAAAGNRLN
jgi:two-component system, cell cycle response regulator